MDIDETNLAVSVIASAVALGALWEARRSRRTMPVPVPVPDKPATEAARPEHTTDRPLRIAAKPERGKIEVAWM
ncbi:hypothetical protein Misp01_16460 [Microtetraspora sp. NBRC 13810]|uniref:hypothetical protein n=1 Tax=Microtetraspora sp. NBRC 13810 TaxID=3030990 RepID=UPI0024A48437|nr:hypothetical protein [Microtetraspora sp. NBRC 13810]GLW06516.1 hypothetical protein Misp01_16460 [Microtetraspora sp. NBRC 13810]